MKRKQFIFGITVALTVLLLMIPMSYFDIYVKTTDFLDHSLRAMVYYVGFGVLFIGGFFSGVMMIVFSFDD